jgi:hypothetical protein
MGTPYNSILFKNKTISQRMEPFWLKKNDVGVF